MVHLVRLVRSRGNGISMICGKSEVSCIHYEKGQCKLKGVVCKPEYKIWG